MSAAKAGYKRYYQRHRETKKAKMRAYYWSHKAEYAARWKAYYAANKQARKLAWALDVSIGEARGIIAASKQRSNFRVTASLNQG